MGKLDDWFRKRKSRKERFHSVSEDQHAGTFPTGIGSLLEERRKEREIANAKSVTTKDVKVSTENPPLNATSAPKVNVKPRTSIFWAFRNGIGRHRTGDSIVPFRASNTSKAMALHTASLPQVRQTPLVSRKPSPIYYGKSDVFSKFSPDLTFYLMDFLDDFSILNLKFSNKRLHAVISLNHLSDDTLKDLKIKYQQQNNPLSGTSVVFPKPPIDEAKMEAFHEKRERRKKQAHGLDVMICGSCCDFLFQVPGISPKDVCRCEDPSFSPTAQYTEWCSTHGPVKDTSETMSSVDSRLWEIEMADSSKDVSHNSFNFEWDFTKVEQDLGEGTIKSNEEQNDPESSTSYVRTSSTKPERKFCTNCGRRKLDTPWQVLSSEDWGEMCGCITYEPLNVKADRKVCVTCLLFTEKKPWPAVNLAEEMCRCPTNHQQQPLVPKPRFTLGETEASKESSQTPT